MSYTTGELAKLCGVTVRTVQFYDNQGLLKPEALSEGGRRLYGEAGLKALQIICMYKSLGLNLSEIKSILSNEGDCREVLIKLLTDRERILEGELAEKRRQRDCIKAVKQQLAAGLAISSNTFIDIQTDMDGKKRLKTAYAVMTVLAVAGFLAETAFVVLWAVKGWWLPFAIGMPCVLLLTVVLWLIYYKNTAYICRDCGKKFKPKPLAMFFAPHTPKTRKLVCPHCGSKKFHFEIYSD